MEQLFYGGGTALGFLPFLVKRQVNPYALVVLMIVSFFSVTQLYKKLDEKKRQSLFYLPLLFVLAALFMGQKPRIGLVLMMVAMFCLGLLMKDDKLFKDNNEKILFIVQILLTLATSMYMFTDSIRLSNIASNVTKL